MKIILQLPDGHLHILTPVREKMIINGVEESDSEYVDSITKQALLNLPSGTIKVKEIQDSELPQSRSFRNQWRHEGATIKPNMPLCRIQKMNEIRKERNKRLKESDLEFVRALESGQNKKALLNKRQQLRDVPQNIDLESIQIPEELTSFNPIWPE